jgi:hypothetical protein
MKPLLSIITLTFFIVIVSLRSKTGRSPEQRPSLDPDILSRDTADTLRGVATIFLYSRASLPATDGEV